jgi:fimbrial chaperone protein
MATKDRATAITVTNEGDTELVMQADIFDWKQKPDGTDDLTLSEDMILAPPIVKLAPKSRQVLRLALTRPPPRREQLTYRLIVREIPEAKPPETGVQVQFALAFSLPVFITPPGAKRQVTCGIERATAKQVLAFCENVGLAYAQAVDFVLTNAAGAKLAVRETGGYILPGMKRSFELDRVEGAPVGAGRAKLTVAQDDASKQTFDVMVPD